MVGYGGFSIFRSFTFKRQIKYLPSNQIILVIKTYTQQGVPNNNNLPNKDPLDISNICPIVNPDR